MTKTELEDEIERFRELVIESRESPSVAKKSLQCVDKLNDCYQSNRRLFSDENIRWLNVLRGYLGVRLDAHKTNGDHKPQGKRKGDAFDHCWRCKTQIDERFVEFCVKCSKKEYQWRRCPVCGACGCQPAGQVLL
jgi:hypothetical protein